MLAGLVVLQWHCFVNCLLTHCKAIDNTQTQVFCYNLRQELFTLQCTTTATGPCYLSLLLVPGHFLLFHSGHCHGGRSPSYVFCIWMLIFGFWILKPSWYLLFGCWYLLFGWLYLLFGCWYLLFMNNLQEVSGCHVLSPENDIAEINVPQIASCPTDDRVQFKAKSRSSHARI